MKLKLLHIVKDEKFIDGAFSLFETDDRVDNTYIIVGEKQDLKYVKCTRIQFVPVEKLFSYIHKFNVILIHSLPVLPLHLLPKISEDIKIVWFAWGYDIYKKPYDIIPLELLGNETKRNTAWERLKIRLHCSYYTKKSYVRKHLKSALSRIDYFSGVFPYEMDLIKNNHPEFKAFPLDFYYGAKDFFIPEQPATKIIHGKKNIIIGNSADITGNHLDVLKRMSTIDIDKDAKIIIPLSYGGSSSYIEKVERKAQALSPGNIYSLRSFLPIDEYLGLISNCRTAVFAHERQQASDNIFMQMIYGARVYMSETSAAFSYLKSIGLKVYSLQNELDLFNEEMSDEDVLTNRKILSSLYSPSKLINRIQVINTTLSQAINNVSI